MKHLTSLRDFIAALERAGQIQPIDVEVDWNLEIGAVTRRSYELRAPAPLFNRIRGIGEGFRVLGAPGGLGSDAKTRFARVALALGLPATRPAVASSKALRGRRPVLASCLGGWTRARARKTAWSGTPSTSIGFPRP
jgi:3-polyprenyl-4-hydroxybenzoate decarboxylase